MEFLSKKWAKLFFLVAFFILVNWFGPHPDGNFRFPKFFFYLCSFPFLITYSLFEDKRYYPFVFFLIPCFIGLLHFQHSWTIVTFLMFFIWILFLLAISKIDYENDFLLLLFIISIFWIVQGILQWFSLDPLIIALNPVTALPDRKVADPVLGMIGNPVWFGPTIAMCIPLLMMLRFGWILAIGLSIVVVLTDSSGAVLTLITAISSLILFSKRRWQCKVLLFTGLLGCLVAIYFFYPMRPIYGSGGWLDENFRFRAWRDLFELWKLRPWMGYALGSFSVTFGPQMMAKYDGALWLQAHNDYLQFFYETGIVGAFFFLWLVYNILTSRVKDRRGYYYLASLLAIGADASVMFPWHLPVSAILTGVVLERFFHYSEKREIVRPLFKFIGRLYGQRLRLQRYGLL